MVIADLIDSRNQPSVGQDLKIEALAWAPDSIHLATADRTGIRIWDTQTRQIQASFPTQTSLCTLAWSIDGLIAVGGRSHRVHILEAASGRSVYEWTLRGSQAAGSTGAAKYGHPSPLGISSLAWSPNGQILLGGGCGEPGYQMSLWERRTGVRQSISVEYNITTVAWSPGGRRFAAAGNLGAIGIWSTTGERLSIRFSEVSPASFFSSISWSPDGLCLAASGPHNEYLVWKISGALLTRQSLGPLSHPLSLAWSPRDERIATASQDGAVQVWHAPSGQCLATYAAPLGHRPPLAWSPDGTRLVCGMANHTLQIWEPK